MPRLPKLKIKRIVIGPTIGYSLMRYNSLSSNPELRKWRKRPSTPSTSICTQTRPATEKPLVPQMSQTLDLPRLSKLFSTGTDRNEYLRQALQYLEGPDVSANPYAALNIAMNAAGLKMDSLAQTAITVFTDHVPPAKLKQAADSLLAGKYPRLAKMAAERMTLKCFAGETAKMRVITEKDYFNTLSPLSSHGYFVFIAGTDEDQMALMELDSIYAPEFSTLAGIHYRRTANPSTIVARYKEALKKTVGSNAPFKTVADDIFLGASFYAMYDESDELRKSFKTSPLREAAEKSASISWNLALAAFEAGDTEDFNYYVMQTGLLDFQYAGKMIKKLHTELGPIFYRISCDESIPWEEKRPLAETIIALADDPVEEAIGLIEATEQCYSDRSEMIGIYRREHKTECDSAEKAWHDFAIITMGEISRLALATPQEVYDSGIAFLEYHDLYGRRTSREAPLVTADSFRDLYDKVLPLTGSDPRASGIALETVVRMARTTAEDTGKPKEGIKILRKYATAFEFPGLENWHRIEFLECLAELCDKAGKKKDAAEARKRIEELRMR